MRTLALAVVPAVALAAACSGDLSVDSPDETGSSDRLPAAEDDDDPGWAAFLERVVPGSQPGVYIVEGDLRLHGERELRAYYDHHARGTRANVSFFGGRDNIQPLNRKLRLTYCVQDSLGRDRDDVVDMLAVATLDWERATDVNFIHLSEHDDDCEPGRLPESVFFAVIKVDGTYNASAFFPDSPASDRVLEITDVGLDRSEDDVTGTLRHELGHILGLRHEHIRNPIDCTDEDTYGDGLGSRDLGPYDGSSIMHYDWCPGAIGDRVNLSRYDVIAIKNLYSLPRDHWIGRLPGYWHETDYDSDGRKDIFWMLENTGTQLWVGRPAPELFFSGADPVFLRAEKPIPGIFGDFHTGFLTYAQGTSSDWLVEATGDGFDYLTSSRPIDGTFQPLVGDFDANGSTDVFWYRPGDHADYLWRPKGSPGSITFTSSELDVDGYYHPIVLDYNDDDLSDIVWYDPYSSSSPVWRGAGNGTFAGTSVDAVSKGLAASGTPYQALVGYFNADSYQDILWYAAGGAPDALWLGGPDGPAQWVLPLEINGAYKPFTGNFVGNSRTSIFWYRPGSDSDVLWTFNADGSHQSIEQKVDGDYSPIVGDFDGDARSDILWFAPHSGQSTLWTSTGGGAFSPTGPWATPANGYPVGYGLTY